MRTRLLTNSERDVNLEQRRIEKIDAFLEKLSSFETKHGVKAMIGRSGSLGAASQAYNASLQFLRGLRSIDLNDLSALQAFDRNFRKTGEAFSQREVYLFTGLFEEWTKLFEFLRTSIPQVKVVVPQTLPPVASKTASLVERTLSSSEPSKGFSSLSDEEAYLLEIFLDLLSSNENRGLLDHNNPSAISRELLGPVELLERIISILRNQASFTSNVSTLLAKSRQHCKSHPNETKKKALGHYIDLLEDAR